MDEALSSQFVLHWTLIVVGSALIGFAIRRGLANLAMASAGALCLLASNW